MLKAKIGVIADDFTGANDTGLQFSKQGAITGVFFNLSEIDKALNKFDVVVFDTESRFDDKETAFNKVLQAAQALTQKGVPHIYKKLDSTMRGNIGAEIDSALEATSAKAAFVAPAAPSMGRTAIGGICYVNGIAVGKSEAARDPVTPIFLSDIPSIIAQQSKRPVECIRLEKVQDSLKTLNESIMSLLNKGIEIIVFDSLNNGDLEMIAKAVNEIDEPKIFVGSSGFAEYVCKVLNIKGPGVKSSYRKHSKENNSPGVLIAAGSLSEVTIAEVYHAIKERFVHVIDLDIKQVFCNRENEIARIVENAGRELTEGKDIIIRTGGKKDDIEKARQIAAKAGFDAFECSENISIFLGETVGKICRDFKPCGLVLTGGDIAIKVLREMKVTGSVIKDEVLPGIASGLFLDKEFQDILFVTKAGGFGQKDSLVKIIDYLKRT